MKIELIKETRAVTGEVIYSVYVNGHYISGTTAINEESANEHFERIKEQAKLYPVDVKETIREEEV